MIYIFLCNKYCFYIQFTIILKNATVYKKSKNHMQFIAVFKNIITNNCDSNIFFCISNTFTFYLKRSAKKSDSKVLSLNTQPSCFLLDKIHPLLKIYPSTRKTKMGIGNCVFLQQRKYADFFLIYSVL